MACANHCLRSSAIEAKYARWLMALNGLPLVLSPERYDIKLDFENTQLNCPVKICQSRRDISSTDVFQMNLMDLTSLTDQKAAFDISYISNIFAQHTVFAFLLLMHLKSFFSFVLFVFSPDVAPVRSPP